MLPPDVTARVAVEQASTFGWERYVGRIGPHHRHEDVRRVGAAQGAATKIRLRAANVSTEIARELLGKRKTAAR